MPESRYRVTVKVLTPPFHTFGIEIPALSAEHARGKILASINTRAVIVKGPELVTSKRPALIGQPTGARKAAREKRTKGKV